MTGVHSSSRFGQRPQQPRLALTALAEQDDVVFGDQRALELRDDGVLEAEDAGPHVAALAERGQQVLADFGLHAPLAVPGRAQLAEGAGEIVR